MRDSLSERARRAWRCTSSVLAILVATTGPLSRVQAQAQAPATSSPPAPSRSARVIGPASLFPYAPGVDVQHYDIALTVPQRGSEISALAVLTVDRALKVDTLRLDLTALTVDAVTVNGRSRDVLRDSLTLRVPLRQRDGTRVRVGVRYHGVPLDGFIVREDSLRGWSGFGDNWPNRGRHWIPSVDHPSDKATVSWSVTAPSEMAVVANGTRESAGRASPPPGATGAWTTTRYRLRQPIPTSLMVVGVARLHETPLGRTACGFGVRGACVPQSVWTFAPETPNMPGSFRAAGRIVTTLAGMVGPFAYDRLSHVQSATRFGGMENASAIFYSDQAFRRNAVEESLIAHETAHQWFGDAVTPRRWADVWLSEGFATYFAALYQQRAHGDSAFLATMRRMRDDVLAAKVVGERPIVDSIGAETPLSLLNANSYQKGGFVLHMLRAEIGDSAFFRALRDYQSRFRHATATTDDLRVLVERRAGRTLRPFFDQWLHRPGFADLAVTWTWRAETSSLVMAVTQHPRSIPFDLPLTLEVQGSNGQRRRVTVRLVAKASQSVEVAVRGFVGEPVTVVADPGVVLLGRVEMLHAMP